MFFSVEAFKRVRIFRYHKRLLLAYKACLMRFQFFKERFQLYQNLNKNDRLNVFLSILIKVNQIFEILLIER